MFIPAKSKNSTTENEHTPSLTRTGKDVSIGHVALRFFLYSLALGLMVLVMTWEAKYSPRETLFSEQSFVEIAQETLLFLIPVVCYFIARMDSSKKGLASILAGMATMAFIRELDFFWDGYVFHGSWQIMVTVTFVMLCIKIYPMRHTLQPAISDFITRSSFGVMAGGFMTVFVFSRLFGRKVLWHAVMGDHFIYAVKSGAEEGTELLGYSLIFIGVLELFLEVRNSCEQKRLQQKTEERHF